MFALPFHSKSGAADADAVPQRLATRLDEIELVIGGIDDDRTGCLAGRVLDDLTPEGPRDLFDGNLGNLVGPSVMAAYINDGLRTFASTLMRGRIAPVESVSSAGMSGIASSRLRVQPASDRLPNPSRRDRRET